MGALTGNIESGGQSATRRRAYDGSVDEGCARIHDLLFDPLSGLRRYGVAIDKRGVNALCRDDTGHRLGNTLCLGRDQNRKDNICLNDQFV